MIYLSFGSHLTVSPEHAVQIQQEIGVRIQARCLPDFWLQHPLRCGVVPAVRLDLDSIHRIRWTNFFCRKKSASA